MNQILLSDKRNGMLLKEYPVMDNTQNVADYAETVAKAQLKKVVEMLLPNSDFTKAMVWANSSAENTVRYVIETLRQILLKEAEMEE